MGEPLHQAPLPETDRGYEHSDVPIRPIAMFLVGLATMLIVVGALMAALFHLFEFGAAGNDPAPAPLAAESPQTPGPLLQTSPRQDLQQMRQREQSWLDTPAWMDRERGVARIPIDRAMAATAERGLTNWPAVDASQAPPRESERDSKQPAARTPEGSGLQTPGEGSGAR
jgi:hypothetical protein